MDPNAQPQLNGGTQNWEARCGIDPSNRPWLVDFYDTAVNAQDPRGRTLEDILHMDDSDIEDHHDFIQHLFPLPERSGVNPDAMLITQQVRCAFLHSHKLRERLMESFERMVQFYGFKIGDETRGLLTSVATGVDMPDEIDAVLQPDNHFEIKSGRTWRVVISHNHLRISRIIRSLCCLGLEFCARAFYRALDFYDPARKVSQRSRLYWARAAARPLHLSPDESDENATGIAWLRTEDEG